MKTLITKTYDFLGIIISFLCGIHCIATPFVLVSSPQLAHSLESPLIHSVLILLMVFSFYQSVFKHYKLHKSMPTLGLGLFGFLFIFTSYANEVIFHSAHTHDHVHENEWGMVAIAIVGAILLMSSHVMNLQKCKCIGSEGSLSS